MSSYEHSENGNDHFLIAMILIVMKKWTAEFV